MSPTFSEIPIVDLGTPDTEALAHHVGRICHEVGFLLVTNHGVPQGLTDAAFEQCARFFDLPVADKLTMDKRASRHFRGWEPQGAEFTNTRPDIREQIDLWTEHAPRAPGVDPNYLRLLGPNQWPPQALLPSFRPTIEQWIRRVSALADELLGMLAVSLELESDHFVHAFGEECMSLCKLIRYPPTPAGQFGVNAHHDAGFLTILAAGTTPGLEVRNALGDWVPVPVVPGTLVVNLGEAMQKMSSNYFVATPHRVATRAARQSMGYFHGPSLDMALSPLELPPAFVKAVAASPRHAQAGFMVQASEVRAGAQDMSSSEHPDIYGEQLWNYFCRSYPDNVKQHYPDG
jgi:isopenicillin N synthase-like dioxygenase